MSTTCKCGAEIEFFKMESGAPMPYRLDSKKLRLVRFAKGRQTYAKLVTTFEPHFVDCPFADEFRKDSQDVDGRKTESSQESGRRAS